MNSTVGLLTHDVLSFLVCTRLDVNDGGIATGGPLEAMTELRSTGFFFPLLEPMFRMGGNPAIRSGSGASCVAVSLCHQTTLFSEFGLQ